MKSLQQAHLVTLAALVPAAMVLAAAVVPATYAHGAAVGIHLHLKPDAAVPGQEVRISIRADVKMTRVEVAFTGYEKHTFELKKPARSHEITLRVPETVKTEVITIHLRAEITSGEPRLTSAILRIMDIPEDEEE